MVSIKNRDLRPHPTPEVRYSVKSDKSDWLNNIERILCACSKAGTGQRSRFLVLTKRIAASGDDNVGKTRSKPSYSCIRMSNVCIFSVIPFLSFPYPEFQLFLHNFAFLKFSFFLCIVCSCARKVNGRIQYDATETLDSACFVFCLKGEK